MEKLYSEKIGLEAYPNIYNKLSDEMILDIRDINNISIKLTKIDMTTNQISIKRNSFIIIESL
jgi:hypothetical protein